MRLLHRIAALLACLAAAVWVAWTGGPGFDYDEDAGPAVDALAGGDVGELFDRQPMMGSLSVLVRAPFAALSRDELTAYRLGAVACLVAGGLLGLWVARLMRERGRSRLERTLVWALCAASPMAFNAVLWGHPEEALGGALCVAAVIAAGRDRPLLAAVALGLALGTKQWAVIAIVPVLLAAPRRRVVLASVAAAIALVLTVPFLVGGTDSFETHTRNASQTGHEVRPLSVYWLFAPERTERVWDGVEMRELSKPTNPMWLGKVPHPLIVLLPIPLGILLARRRPEARDALGLLALLFLARCALDPVDNGYYHLPFLLTLASWEGLRREGLPVLSLVSATVLWVMVKHVPADQVDAASAAYLAWAAGTATVIARAVYGPVRKPARAKAPAGAALSARN
jgi:hypothetical protein